MNFQVENTVDLFERAPKLISTQVHRWIDIAAASAFAVVGGFFLGRGSGRAAAAAFINGGTAAGVSLLTDYDGDGAKPVRLKMHDFLDLVLAAMSAAEPLLFGFARHEEAAFFYGSGTGVVSVVATTELESWRTQSAAPRTRGISLFTTGGAREPRRPERFVYRWNGDSGAY